MKKTTKEPNLLHILVVGVGNMGASLAHGLLKSELSSRIALHLYDHMPQKTAPFKASKSVTIHSSLGGSNPLDFDVVVISTKPQDMDTVGKQLKGKIPKKSLVISILAATTIDEITAALKFEGSVVRAMPNIAAIIGEAATALTANAICSPDNLKLAEEIFSCIGTASWTNESLMNTVTGLSGSGPAYIYMVIEALTDGGVKMGLPRPLALELATQTVIGSAKLVQKTGTHPAVLRDQVTTPGGTTICAIHELEERGLRAMLMSAVVTATNKSEFLAKAKK
jgi:pyrroline-5-carboxylate reductase